MKVDPSKKTVESGPIHAGDAGFSLVISVGNEILVRDLPDCGTVELGRKPGCAIFLDDESISRRHARIHCGGGLLIEDLGSTNGTRVLGGSVLASERVAVPMGAVIQLGSVVAFVRPRGLPVNAAPIPRARRDAIGDDSVVVCNARMRELYELLDVVAPSPFPILILGETGVGKDVFAEAIHRRSPRGSQRFMRLNCAALAESLLESELFGHQKGAFTGAISTKEGLFEAANGGTVFLDEIGEMPLSTQAKLLRALEGGEVMRVGSIHPIHVDVRFVAATNRDLPARCETGAFRSDLYFRLSGVVVTIPPLRERPEDVVALAEHFAREAAKRLGRSETIYFSSGSAAKMKAHGWPGNIRELRNTVERAVLMARGATIDEQDIVLQAGPRLAAGSPPVEQAVARAVEVAPALPAQHGALAAELRELERQRIVEALKAVGGNQSRAARALGISRGVLIKRLKAYGLARPRKNVHRE